MNLREFGALKVGDKFENPMNGSEGVVSAILPTGVKVRWPPSTLEFTYTVNSTAWMHWSLLATSDKLDAFNAACDMQTGKPSA